MNAGAVLSIETSSGFDIAEETPDFDDLAVIVWRPSCIANSVGTV